MTKTCKGCHRDLPLTQFQHHGKTKDGYTLRCSECIAKAPVPRTEAHRRREAGWRESNLTAIRTKARAFRRKIREAVLQHYGGRCACCAEARFEFLSIDHIDGGGRQHRKQIKVVLDYWLWRKGFPSGFRVLCHNCNMAYGVYGYCPHQQLTSEAPNVILSPVPDPVSTGGTPCSPP